MALLILSMEEGKNHVTVSRKNELRVNVVCGENDVEFGPDIRPGGLYDGIYITFPEGEGEKELQKDIKNISVSISDKPDWSVSLQKEKGIWGNDNSPMWVLRPAGGGWVRKGDAFTIHVDNIQCNDVTGMTEMRIYQQTAEETEKDNNLDIIKCSLAKIIKFTIRESDYNMGDTVHFCWEIQGMDAYSKIIFDNAGEIEPTQTGMDDEIHNRDYKLSVVNGSSYIAQESLAPKFIFFHSFEITAGDGKKNTLTLEWKTGNLGSCQLLYGAQTMNVELQGGTRTISVEGEADKAEFILRMTEGETGKALEDKKCVYAFPKVTKFKACRTSDFIGVEQLKELEARSRNCPPYAEPPSPPKPPEPQPITFPVQIEWDSEHAVGCSLEGVPEVKETKGSVSVNLTEVPQKKLYAYDEYGFKRGKDNEVKPV